MARVPTGESVVARAVRIIEAFELDDTSLSVSEIARRSGLHIATASRLIDELARTGWLEREERGVRIGMRLWEVASRASAARGLREVALPFMEDLHAVVGQHVQLAVLEGEEVLFIERFSAPNATANFTRIAGRLPLHASSSGLVPLAHGPRELRDSVLARPLKVFTDTTIRNARALRVALAEVRRQGYALCAGHIHPDTTGIAVPLYRDGSVLAALGLVVPNDNGAYAQLPALQATALGITRALSAPRSRR